jgi:Spy/CpxP family protein refolding chaperone
VAVAIFVLAAAAGRPLSAGQDTPALQEKPSTPSNPDDTLRRRVEMRLSGLSSRLGLTEEQKLKIRPLLEKQMRDLRTLRTDPELSVEDQQARMLALHEGYQKELRAQLTPEQRAKLDELREKRRAEREEPWGPAKKRRVPVDEAE